MLEIPNLRCTLKNFAEAFAYTIRSSTNSNTTSCFGKLKLKVICTAIFLGLILIYFLNIERKKERE